MINSRIAISLASIVTAGSLLVGATLATFSDTSTSNGNVFAAGTMHLALCDTLTDASFSAVPEPCPSPNASQSVTASFGKTNLKPGDCIGPQTLTIKNNGSVDASSVVLNAAINSDTTIAPFLRINSITFGVNAVPVTDQAPLNLYPDLYDLQGTAPLILPLSALAAGSSKDLVMDVCLDNTATTAVQGLSDMLSLSFTMNQ